MQTVTIILEHLNYASRSVAEFPLTFLRLIEMKTNGENLLSLSWGMTIQSEQRLRTLAVRM